MSAAGFPNTYMAAATSGLRAPPHSSTNSLWQVVGEHSQRRRSPRSTWLVTDKHGKITLMADMRMRAMETEAADLSIERGGYLAEEFGWGVRRMAETEEEMRKVASVQAEAFHAPVAIFNDLFYEFFRAEVLSALIYKIRNSPPDRYACLVAESSCVPDLLAESVEGLAGAADCTVQRDVDILRHLHGAEEYLYVSGIAVRSIFRRRKVGTVLLKACDALSRLWGHDYVALRAYEDDSAARQLYSKAGFKTVSSDPHWIAWVGKKRRILMIKSIAL